MIVVIVDGRSMGTRLVNDERMCPNDEQNSLVNNVKNEMKIRKEC